MNGGSKTHWLVLVRPQGVVEVRMRTEIQWRWLTTFATDLDASEAHTCVFHNAPANA